MTDDNDHNQPARPGRFRRAGKMPAVEVPDLPAGDRREPDHHPQTSNPGDTPELRVDPKDRPADAPTGEPATVVIHRTGWGAVLLALLAIAIAVGTALLPILKPRLLAQFGDIPAVAFLLGPKDGRDAALQALRGDLTAVDGRVAAAEQKTGDAVGRLDAIETRLKEQAASVAPLPADATPEQVQAWSATLASRLDAAEAAAREAQAGLDAATARLTAFEERVAAVGATDGNIRGMAERLGAVESMATQTGDTLVATQAEVSVLTQEVAAGKAEATKLAEDAAATQMRLTQIGEGVESGKSELAALKTGLDEAKQAAAAAQSTATETKAAAEQLATRMAALEARADQIAQSVDASGAKLAAIEETTQARNDGLHTARLTQAIFHLSDALETHKPFVREIAFLRSVAADDARLGPLVEPIVVYADSGVATNAELRDSFSAIVAPKLLSIADDSRPWLDQLRSWVSSAIAPEPAPQPLTGVDPTRQIVNGAVRSLAEDDLLTAVELLSRLEGPAGVLTQRWLAEAHARLTLDQTREKLAGLAMEMLQPEKP